MRLETVAAPGSEWDAFVESSPGAALGHAAAWAAVLERAYGLGPACLAACGSEGSLEGVLPLVWFRSLRGRRELVSLPFLDTGGILARDPRAEQALLERALRLAREEGARALELRQPLPLAGAPAPGAARRLDLALRLEPDPDAQWKRLPAKTRNQVRKARKEGLRILAGPPERLGRQFYQVFRVNQRDLGSPVHAESFFLAAAEGFGARLRFVVAALGERPVAGLVAIHFAGRVTVPWAASLRSELARCPNHLAYWEALRWALEQGAREFDFGRSPPGSGSHRFKLGWGAEERPLPWLRLRAADGAPLPLGSSGDSRLLRGLSRVWMRLPVVVTAQLGPSVRRLLAE